MDTGQQQLAAQFGRFSTVGQAGYVVVSSWCAMKLSGCIVSVNVTCAKRQSGCRRPLVPGGQQPTFTKRTSGSTER